MNGAPGEVGYLGFVVGLRSGRPAQLSSSMQKKVSAYPIYGLSEYWDRDPFDLSLLPFRISEDVAIEPVADSLKVSLGYFEKFSPREAEKMRSVKFALVHRYETKANFVNDGDDAAANQLLHKLAACLRLGRVHANG